MFCKTLEPLAHGFFVHADCLRDLRDFVPFTGQADDLGTLDQSRFFGPRLTPFLDRSAFFFAQRPQTQRHAFSSFALSFHLLQLYHLLSECTTKLTGTHLEGADLSHGYLEGTDFTKAHLNNAILIDAHLKNADLTDACLERALLAGVDLEMAKLIRADVKGAELTEAHLVGHLPFPTALPTGL